MNDGNMPINEKSQSIIDQELGCLDNRIGYLLGEIDTLEARLAPVLGQPLPEGPTAEGVMQSVSPLATTVRDQCGRITVAVSRLESILDRCQL